MSTNSFHSSLLSILSFPHSFFFSSLSFSPHVADPAPLKTRVNCSSSVFAGNDILCSIRLFSGAIVSTTAYARDFSFIDTSSSSPSSLVPAFALDNPALYCSSNFVLRARTNIMGEFANASFVVKLMNVTVAAPSFSILPGIAVASASFLFCVFH